LSSYKGQNEDWLYRFKNKEEEEEEEEEEKHEDSSNSKTRQRSAILLLLGVLGSLVSGAAGVAKAVNDSKMAQR